MEDHKLHNIMVATDGSKYSQKAFDLALQFFEQNLFQQIIVCHISNSKKSYLAPEFQPEQIHQTYKTELLSLYPSSRYRLIFEEQRAEFSSCRDQLLAIANNVQVSLLFIGYSGRKGEKGEATVLAQTVKYCVFHSSVPLFICKRESKREEQTSKGFTFMACVDGSKKGWKGLNLALKLATHKEDKVLLCYAPSPDRVGFENNLKQQAEDILEDKTKNWDMVILKASYNPGEQLVDYINNNEKYYINFIIIGSNGYRAQMEKGSFFGRTAENLVTNAKCNPIILASD